MDPRQMVLMLHNMLQPAWSRKVVRGGTQPALDNRRGLKGYRGSKLTHSANKINDLVK